MPDMVEIYQHHSAEYHELVRHEDWQGNLRALLGELAPWDGARVMEAGTGTGRVTAMYMDRVAHATCCDGSRHMLDAARENLRTHNDIIRFEVADNLDLPKPHPLADIFIQGWAFGHSVFAHAEQIATVTRRLVESAAATVHPGGHIIFIETLGTCTAGPGAPHPVLEQFYTHLEHEHHFVRHAVATDYRFATRKDAVRIMGFFFGEEMARTVTELNDAVVPEWTGVWIR